MVALATTLMSTTAMGGERTVTAPTPKSITLVCSDDVRQGTVVLSNPPKFSCKDYELVKSVVGTGITVGPDANVNRITAALRRANEVKVTKKDGVETYDNGRTIVRWRNNDNRNNHNNMVITKTRSRIKQLCRRKGGVINSLGQCVMPKVGMEDKFPGTTRNREWFNELAPIQVSDDPSGRCSGWINLNDILSGKCGKVKVQLP